MGAIKKHTSWGTQKRHCWKGKIKIWTPSLRKLIHMPRWKSREKNALSTSLVGNLLARPKTCSSAESKCLLFQRGSLRQPCFYHTTKMAARLSNSFNRCICGLSLQKKPNLWHYKTQKKGLKSSLSRSVEMAWNVAAWPWETIPGECVQRDEIAKLFFDAEGMRFTEIKPSSKSWTKDWLKSFSDSNTGKRL